MRIALATDLTTRDGTLTKDAKIVNAFVDDGNVFKRPAAQGGVSVGAGTAQGGIGFYIGSTPYFIGFWGDTLVNYTGNGSNWSSGTSYATGDMVSMGFKNYWAIDANTNSQPPSSHWSSSRTYYTPPVTPSYTYAILEAFAGAGASLSGDGLTFSRLDGYNYSQAAASVQSIKLYSGKWYWEVTLNTASYASVGVGFGNTTAHEIGLYSDEYAANHTGNTALTSPYNAPYKLNNNTPTAYGGTAAANGAVIGIAFDVDNGTLEYFKNGVSIGQAFAGIQVPIYDPIDGWDIGYSVMVSFAQCNDPNSSVGSITANFGATPFTYTPPTGFNAGVYV